MAVTYEVISSNTLTSSSSTVNFTSIPQTYTDLRLVIRPLATGASSYNIFMTCNNNTGASKYGRVYIYGGVASGGSTVTNATNLNLIIDGFRNTYNTLYTLDFFNYTTTNLYKPILISDNETSYSGGFSLASFRDKTNPISSLQFSTDAGNSYNIGSVFTLYGIKAA